MKAAYDWFAIPMRVALRADQRSIKAQRLAFIAGAHAVLNAILDDRDFSDCLNEHALERMDAMNKELMEIK